MNHFLPPRQLAIETHVDRIGFKNENRSVVGGGQVIVISREAWDNILRLQAVADAARVKCRLYIDTNSGDSYDNGAAHAAREILRAMDGEP